ncbi:major capsid protein [Sigmofec virus UA08Rod_5594]|uniref:Major capsid protein n=1 Tax=Sigmofec virus UA08Rod_5594 TaxID=2929430 RepID=A0A976R8K0_9VIRU|nr:major capsid protein [Sigmofec virus UA08Rod_5594]
MTRNTESRFATNPTRLDMSRSRFSRGSGVKTSFNAGQLVPFWVEEVLPGDTHSVKTSKVIRMPSLITPIMDNLYLDTYYFFVPSRLVWEHWRELMGENSQSAWIPEVEYEVPQITSPVGTGWQVGTIADYMGIPTGVPGLSVNALPIRAYALICNEWFRDENLTDPLNIPTGDATVAGVNTGNYINDVAKGGQPFLAAKYHDYFTSALPSPQKGPDVTIPVTQPGNLPVMALNAEVPNQSYGVTMRPGTAGTNPSNPTEGYYSHLSMSSGDGSGSVRNFLRGQTAGTSFSADSALSPNVVFSNLWAVQSGDAAVATINQLRTAWQIQRMYERDARSGTRYIEVLKGHFGVTSPDSRLQRPEYLGGNRLPITISQVLQSSPTSDSPQGTPTGQSLTTDVHGDFSYSAVEHGYIIGLMVVRYDHVYQQGLDRLWSRRDRFDFYWPVFANLGEQAVLNKEIYAQGSAQDNEVFGYQEAWADYRYKPSHVTGMMRSQYSESLDSWHIADYYKALPRLSDAWIREDKSNIDRTIAVSSEITHQFFADIWVDCVSTRPMPLYSIPGLVDHH